PGMLIVDRSRKQHHQDGCGTTKPKPRAITTATMASARRKSRPNRRASEHELFLTETFLPCRALPFVARWLFRSSPARSVSSKNRKQKIRYLRFSRESGCRKRIAP